MNDMRMFKDGEDRILPADEGMAAQYLHTVLTEAVTNALVPEGSPAVLRKAAADAVELGIRKALLILRLQSPPAMFG